MIMKRRDIHAPVMGVKKEEVMANCTVCGTPTIYSGRCAKCCGKVLETYDAVVAERDELLKSRATHKVSACYFPGIGIAELTWENIETGKSFGMTVNVTKDQGKALSEIMLPCVYHPTEIKT